MFSFINLTTVWKFEDHHDPFLQFTDSQDTTEVMNWTASMSINVSVCLAFKRGKTWNYCVYWLREADLLLQLVEICISCGGSSEVLGCTTQPDPLSEGAGVIQTPDGLEMASSRRSTFSFRQEMFVYYPGRCF